MEIKITTPHILKILYYLSWIIFIGLCIEAGSFLFNGIYTLTYNSYNARYLGLLDLHEFDPVYYLNEILFISIVAVLKAILFYLIVKILHEKKLNMVQPFNPQMGRFLFHITFLTFGIGLFINWAVNFNKWIISNNVKMPAPETLHLEGADVWFFMSVILFVIAQIFKRGIEIQSENELTI